MAKKNIKQPEKKSNMKLAYILLALLVIAALALYFSMSSTLVETPVEKLPSDGKYVKLTDKPTTYEQGKVKIIEFLKFNCGHCNTLNQQLPGLKQKYGDKLIIIYKPMLWRNLPQDQPFRKSIEAYILADRMGKGEEMKDALFNAMFIDKKDLTSEIALSDIAKSIGLGDNFSTALKNGDAKDEAEANIRLAESFQVEETPTVIINGNLKITPSLTNNDMNQMTGNLDTVISSLLS